MICNTWNSSFLYIPEALYLILTKFEGWAKEDIQKYFNNEEDEYINSYFKFLEDNELGFYCTSHEQKLFPKINYNFTQPYLISNCIIDIAETSWFNYENIYTQMSRLGCHFYQLRFFSIPKLSLMNKILKSSLNFHIRSIEIITPYSSILENDDMFHFYKKYSITQIIFYSTPINKLCYLLK